MITERKQIRLADVCKPKKYLTKESAIFLPGKKDTIICNFDKVFPNMEKKNLNVFYILRPAFYNKADLICDNINIFMDYYDKDKEFITCYINLKVKTDLTIMTYTFTSFIADVINQLFSESMIQKIRNFVDDQYRIDLEASTDKDKYKDNPHQFTNKHGKILMCISTAIKFIIPIISHYYVVRKEMLDSMVMKKYLYHCFYALFPLFEEDTLVYNKIYATVDKAVSNSEYSDSGMWKRNKNKGITPSFEKTRITKMVIQDLIYKYTFDEIMINLNYAGIRRTLKHTIEGKDSHDYSDINTKRSDNKMSGLEQLEMNAAKIDERDIIISSHGSQNKVKRLASQYGLEITDEDLKFYKENLNMNSAQTNIVLQFFADDFRGLENMKFIKRKDFFKLVIIMKEELIKRGFKVVPSLITGSPSNKIKGRKMGSKKFNKVKFLPRYYNLMKQYRDVASSINEDIVMKYISSFINVPLVYVDHTDKDKLGEEIEVNENLVIDETIRLIEMF
jgi:hypothetical protein